MSIREMRNDLEGIIALGGAIASNTTTAGAILDLQGCESGVSFYISAAAYTDGTYTPLVEDGDAANLSDAAAVADAQLIGTEAAAALSADTANGAVLKSIGYIGSKRYVRLSIVSSGTTSGATIAVFALKNKDVKPVA